MVGRRLPGGEQRHLLTVTMACRAPAFSSRYPSLTRALHFSDGAALDSRRGRRIGQHERIRDPAFTIHLPRLLSAPPERVYGSLVSLGRLIDSVGVVRPFGGMGVI